MTRTGQPAMLAGTASISAVEGRGAVPAGTYSPTDSSATVMRSQTTPGAVSSRNGGSFCSSWKRVIVSIARSSAARCTGVRAVSAAANSASDTPNDSRWTPSSLAVYSRSASSPRARTSATIERACASRPAASRWTGRRSTASRVAASSESQSRMSSGLFMRAFSPLAAPGPRWRRRLSGFRASPRTRFRDTRRAPRLYRRCRPTG